jgi:hypothetical protein
VKNIYREEAITVGLSQSGDERRLATRERSGGVSSKIADCSSALFGDPRWFWKWDRVVPRLGLRFAVREVRSIILASSDRRSKDGTLNSPVR